jgi:NAD(P)-dependent dehydrogenase (short-subunit alcohol dehydrogenase family)
VAGLVAETRGRFGRIDVLVNNAGVGVIRVKQDFFQKPPGFWEVKPGDWREIVDTNLTGVFLVSKMVIPWMLLERKGKIINIGSTEFSHTAKGFGPYGASKAGMAAFTTIMARDLEEYGVQTFLLIPGGPIRTGMMPKEIPAELKSQILPPEVVVPAAVFLASDESLGLTGQTISAVQWNREHGVS